MQGEGIVRVSITKDEESLCWCGIVWVNGQWAHTTPLLPTPEEARQEVNEWLALSEYKDLERVEQ